RTRRDWHPRTSEADVLGIGKRAVSPPVPEMFVQALGQVVVVLSRRKPTAVEVGGQRIERRVASQGEILRPQLFDLEPDLRPPRFKDLVDGPPVSHRTFLCVPPPAPASPLTVHPYPALPRRIGAREIHVGVAPQRRG